MFRYETNRHNVAFCFISCLLEFDGWDDCVVMDSTFTKRNSSYYFQFKLLVILVILLYHIPLYWMYKELQDAAWQRCRMPAHTSDCYFTVVKVTQKQWVAVQRRWNEKKSLAQWPWLATSFYSVCNPSALRTFIEGNGAKQSSNA